MAGLRVGASSNKSVGSISKDVRGQQQAVTDAKDRFKANSGDVVTSLNQLSSNSSGNIAAKQRLTTARKSISSGFKQLKLSFLQKIKSSSKE